MENYFCDNRDGKIYRLVKIGNQVWMAENLAFLPEVGPYDKKSMFEPYFYVYGYQGTDVDEAKATENFKTYGVLYNFLAAFSSAPEGWHLPSSQEWMELISFVGGYGNANCVLREAQCAHWASPNICATDEYGFTMLPAGKHFGNSSGIGNYATFWTTTPLSTEILAIPFYNLQLGTGDVHLNSYGLDKREGISVRCIKN